MEREETLPRRRRSKSTRATTPIFLSEVDCVPPTKPVVYSPVPTIRTDGGAMVYGDIGLGYSLYWLFKRVTQTESPLGEE